MLDALGTVYLYYLQDAVEVFVVHTEYIAMAVRCMSCVKMSQQRPQLRFERAGIVKTSARPSENRWYDSSIHQRRRLLSAHDATYRARRACNKRGSRTVILIDTKTNRPQPLSSSLSQTQLEHIQGHPSKRSLMRR